MRRRHTPWAPLAAAACLLPWAASAVEPWDLHFGEALFHAHQGHHFEALERLDAEIAQHYGVDEPELDSLYPQIGHAEFSVGDFELNYRMHLRAGRAITAVLEADVPDPVRNEAAYRLARIHFQKQQHYAALHALDRIEGEVPEDVRDDVAFLRANVLMAIGRPADATDVLRDLQAADDLTGFADYNLGIALLQDGKPDQAVDQLDRAGRVRANEPETFAIRDKSNLVLGALLFEAEEFERAQESLDRVRLEGPFSNQALLRAGWSGASAERFDRALVPWGLLAERRTSDAAVQEAILALPYAYSKLEVHGRAAMLYGRAVEVFGGELVRLDASVESIREGTFLEALAREEIRQSKDWAIRLRSLPDAPETFYLMELMASHDFQTALQNYLDLEDMRKKLVAWQGSFDAFEDVIALRRGYYEPLLPETDEQFRQLDARVRLRLEQRDRLEERLQRLLIAPRPEHLASAEEYALTQRLDALEARLGTGEDDDALRRRIARLRGLVTWSVEIHYHERLTRAHEHLRELTASIDLMQGRYDAFVRTRQAATHSYVGYGDDIDDLRARTARAIEELDRLRARQGHLLESVANAELRHRRERLEAYLDQARFALADSYDRAAKTQARVE